MRERRRREVALKKATKRRGPFDQFTGICSITIENFKGVGKSITVPLKPITLLFGENSAGKSTILHALLYLSEILSNRKADIDQVDLCGTTLSLGGFRQFVYRHETDRTIHIAVTCQLDGEKIEPYQGVHESADFWEHEDEYEAMNVHKLHRIDTVFLEIGVAASTPHGARVKTFAAGINGKEVIRGVYDEERPTDPKKWSLNESHPLVKKALRTVPFFCNDLGLLKRCGGISFLSDAFDCALPNLDKPVTIMYPDYDSWEGLGVKPPEEFSECEGPVSSFFDQLLVGITNHVHKQLKNLRYTGPLRVVPPREGFQIWQNAKQNWADGSAAWATLVDPELNLQRQPEGEFAKRPPPDQ